MEKVSPSYPSTWKKILIYNCCKVEIYSHFTIQWSRNPSHVVGAINVGSGCGFGDNWIMCPHVCKLLQVVGKMTPYCHGSVWVVCTQYWYDVYCVLIIGGARPPLLKYWGGGGPVAPLAPPGSYSTGIGSRRAPGAGAPLLAEELTS